MTSGKLSMGKIYIAVSMGLFVTAVVTLGLSFALTGNKSVIISGLILFLLLGAWFGIFAAFVRKKLVQFTSALCQTLDDMTKGNAAPQRSSEEETLFVKVNHRLIRLYEIMQENRRRVWEEKKALQELTSDISHQVKTPVSNLKIVISTLLTQKMPEDKQREFLQAMEGQLDKLEFLMQGMIKTSRLETGVITLAKKPGLLYETLAAALGGILLSAEKKGINVAVNCPDNLTVSHDTKWTAEALFNILDNGVKYTPDGGSITVSVIPLEMYMKIDIADNGKGISESRQAEIFKRFYREEEVHHIEGIGIGLYLAREIITMQGGYIKVTSEIGKGSTFSVFLPKE